MAWILNIPNKLSLDLGGSGADILKMLTPRLCGGHRTQDRDTYKTISIFQAREITEVKIVIFFFTFHKKQFPSDTKNNGDGDNQIANFCLNLKFSC